MQKKLYAKVYVDNTSYTFDDAFDYLVPEELTTTLKKGCRVLVPFGRGDKKRQGMVVNIAFDVDIPKDIKLKYITKQIDDTPVFTDEMFKMMDFLVNTTFCTHYEAIKAILPNAYGVLIKTKYVANQTVDINDYSDKEQKLLSFLHINKDESEVIEFISQNDDLNENILNKLLKNNDILKIENLDRKVNDKTINCYALSDTYFVIGDSVKFTPKQKEVISFLENVMIATKKEICYFCGVTEGVLKTLIKRGLLKQVKREVLRTENKGVDEKIDIKDIKLSDEQQTIFDSLNDLRKQNKPNVALLHGVTGSGKTSVFIKLIDKTINDNKKALMLVPEISLTPQLLKKFKSIFGNKIAVFHSNLSLGEKLDEYKRILRGKVDIVIGTRSAVFLPLEHIGLIVMDEEAESSYKSDANPRYHAREVAKFRIIHHNAMLLLASATPSIESYYKANIGVYSLFSMKNRYNDIPLPDVYIVDRTKEEKDANIYAISRILKDEIQKNLENNEQTILFINRRGFNTVASCLDCGEVIKCHKCDVPMTYHKANGYLMCHYCGHSKKFKNHCSKCKGHRINLTGIGTQKIEEELKTLFDNARILRMDTDSTNSKYSYEKYFDDFKNHKYDILIGTQMIAKGLDFPNVTLVGVVDADSGLYSLDFRGAEKVFSLITQVVGRSGRANKLGRAFIQTYNAENEVLSFASSQNYKAFYDDEIENRKFLKYPPFCDICIISFSGIKEERVDNASQYFLGILREVIEKYNGKLPLEVSSPIKPSIYKLNQKYRQKIIIKTKFTSKFRTYLKECLKLTAKNKYFSNIKITVDINGDINA